jgi:hypothetical protein
MLSTMLHQKRYVLNGVLRPIPRCLVRAEPQVLTGTHVLYPYTPQSSDGLALMRTPSFKEVENPIQTLSPRLTTCFVL